MIVTALNTIERYAQWTDLYIERILPGDYACIVLAHTPNGFKFDRDEFLKIKDMPWVVLDFREYGWNTSFKNKDLLGADQEQQPMYSGEEWDALNFHACFPEIIAYFKREFSPEVGQLTPPFPVYPIDLISRDRPMPEPVTKDAYLSRLRQIMHVFGYSHEDRRELRSALWGPLGTTAWEMCSVLEEIHHTNRKPLSRILQIQGECLLSTALPGCGHKTFRHSESCVNCVPVVSDCGMRFSVPWTEENAVLLPTVDGRIDHQDSVRRIVEALQDKETLWQKYLAAQVSAAMLDQNVYMKTINNIIQSHLHDT